MNSPLNPALLNRHGFQKLEDFKSYSEWEDYAKQKIQQVLSIQQNKVERITISDFMSSNQFKDSRVQTGLPEEKRVSNMIDDPLPPYDFEGATFDDNISTSLGPAESWYKKAKWPNSWKKFDPSILATSLTITEQMRYAKTGVKRSNEPRYINDKLQRRDWGFRENILQGYPEYEPWFYGSNKVIMGFVTAGSGVFGGIKSNSNLKYNRLEKFRQAEFGAGRLNGNEMIPTGLCFIQDETSGIGISLGSDIRYMYHPKIYKFNFANPAIYGDEMHMGSMFIPKADYRQFLRVGDFVVIEIGTNFKYWHSVLGMQPRYWEELYGEYDGVDFSKIDTYEQHYSQPEDDQYVDLYGEKNSGWDVSISNVPRNQEHADFIRSKRSGKNRPPYIDGWGGFQNPATNQKVLEGIAGIDTPLKWYIHPEDMGPDAPPRGSLEVGEYSHYPIQEDHPWSSGTPVPVNAGMPYIMSSDFLVDNTDRKNPHPLVLKNHEFRGIPLFTLDQYRKNDQRINPDTTWKNPGNNAWELIRPGSSYKGRLVRLEGVRFVLPPVKKQIFVDQSTEEEQNATQETLTNFSEEFIKAINEDTLSDFKLVLAYFGERTHPRSALLRDLKGYNSVQEIALLNNQVDGRGYKFTFDWNSTVNILRGLSADGSNLNVVETIINLSAIALDVFAPGAGQALSIAFKLVNNSSDIPDYDVEEDGDIGRYLSYKKVETELPFPKTVDSSAGGYWWVNPNIPLPNARSHYKDYKETTAVDTLGDYADEVSLGLGLLGGFIDLTRNVWTQLKSSTKLPEDLVKRRFVKDLGERYYQYYEPFAEEWKPFRRNFVYDPITNTSTLQYVYNKFRPIPTGSFFSPNKIYYVVDRNNVVVPIRINPNSEIARFNLPIPTGTCNITGIAWQNSLGKPGLEWEREAYNMELWPRFASDIISTQPRFGQQDSEKREIDRPDFVQKYPNPKTTYPKRIQSSMYINPDMLDCYRLEEYLLELQYQQRWLAGYYRGNPIYHDADFCETLEMNKSVIINWEYSGRTTNTWYKVFRITKVPQTPLNPSFGTTKGQYRKSFYRCKCEEIAVRNGRAPVPK